MSNQVRVTLKNGTSYDGVITAKTRNQTTMTLTDGTTNYVPTWAVKTIIAL